MVEPTARSRRLYRHVPWPRIQTIGFISLAVPAAVVFTLTFFRPEAIRGSFGLLLANLPLTLPLLNVTMAILLDPRGLGRLDGWFRLTGPLALGLVSFSIWYFVASQTSDQYIRVSDERVLQKDSALLLVIMSFIWAGYCSVVSMIAEHADDSHQAVWRRWRFVNLSLAIAFLLLPFGLFQDKAAVEEEIGASLDAKNFAVSIPYRDSAMNLRLGTTTPPVTQTRLFSDISAKTSAEAISIAKTRFEQSEAYWQSATSSDGTRLPVEIVESWIVAQEAP